MFPQSCVPLILQKWLLAVVPPKAYMTSALEAIFSSTVLFPTKSPSFWLCTQRRHLKICFTVCENVALVYNCNSRISLFLPLSPDTYFGDFSIHGHKSCFHLCHGSSSNLSLAYSSQLVTTAWKVTLDHAYLKELQTVAVAFLFSVACAEN